MRIAYFVQDLGDPAVARRVTMLRRGDAEVDLYGFHRDPTPPVMVGGVVAHSLGRTHDGRLAKRAASVVDRAARVGSWGGAIAGADLLIARNLECIALAAVARRRWCRRTPLIYELLDIHSALLGGGPASVALRMIEDRLCRISSAILISSPAFERDYLNRQHPNHPPTILLENKVFGAAPPPITPRVPGPPWRIGWFGAIRCKRSLNCLDQLTKSHPGLVEVDIRGRFAKTDLGDVDGLLQRNPAIRYHGPYRYPDDLSAIYGAVHFAWAIDFFEAGQNSAWLLPNRLYEGGLHAAIPIALSSVETGHWLNAHGLGLTIDEPLEASVENLFTTLTPMRYQQSFDRVSQADRSLFHFDDQDCVRLVQRLRDIAT